MKRSLLILAALAAPSLIVAQDGPRPISLQEALDMARKNAPSMVQARGQMRTSTAALRAARWAFGPNLQLGYSSSTGGGGTYVGDRLVASSARGFTFSQSLGGVSLTLFDGGQKLLNVRRQEALVDQAEINEVTQSFTIQQQVKTQYYAILAARESETAANSQLAQATQQYNAASARLHAGTATRGDSLTAWVTLGNARQAILNAQYQARNANAQLTRLTGSPYEVTAIASDTTDPAPLQMSDAELFALAERGPAVRSSEAQLASARASERSSRASYWPTISLSGSFSRTPAPNTRVDTVGGRAVTTTLPRLVYDFGGGRMNYNWSAGLSASYQLWNSYSRESQVISAKVQSDNAEASLRNEKLLARQNMTQQLNTLRTAEAQIRLARDNLTAAEEALRVATTRYELGAGTLQDVLTAQTSANNQRTALINARFSARNARAAIESIIGRELPQ
jgi:outer membrane protein